MYKKWNDQSLSFFLLITSKRYNAQEKFLQAIALLLKVINVDGNNLQGTVH